jgi:hypothetical protein
MSLSLYYPRSINSHRTKDAIITQITYEVIVWSKIRVAGGVNIVLEEMYRGDVYYLGQGIPFKVKIIKYFILL